LLTQWLLRLSGKEISMSPQIDEREEDRGDRPQWEIGHAEPQADGALKQIGHDQFGQEGSQIVEPPTARLLELMKQDYQRRTAIAKIVGILRGLSKEEIKWLEENYPDRDDILQNLNDRDRADF